MSEKLLSELDARKTDAFLRDRNPGFWESKTGSSLDFQSIKQLDYLYSSSTVLVLYWKKLDLISRISI